MKMVKFYQNNIISKICPQHFLRVYIFPLANNFILQENMSDSFPGSKITLVLQQFLLQRKKYEYVKIFSLKCDNNNNFLCAERVRRNVLQTHHNQV